MKLLMMTHGDRQIDGDRVSPRHSPYRKPTTSYIQRHMGSPEYYDSQYGVYTNDSPLNLSTTPTFITSQVLTTPETDEMLLSAAEEHLRPLIKKELRYTIQNKRLAKGLPADVEVEFSIKDSQPISAEANQKRQRRRERNKLAAAKCRYKKKVLSDQLQAESEELESHNIRLKKEVQRLQEERQKLTYILNLHRPTCIVRSPESVLPTFDTEETSGTENETFRFDLEHKTEKERTRRTPSTDSDTSSMTSYGNYDEVTPSVIVATSNFMSFCDKS